MGKRSWVVAAVLAVGATVLAVPSTASAEPPTAERIGGENRFATAAQVSQRLDRCQIVVANGQDFPDGLAANSLGLPVLLSRTDRLPRETLDELGRIRSRCKVGVRKVHVVGGTAAISEAVVEQLRQHAPNGVVRHAGADRYGTAVAVAERISGFASLLTVGAKFPDALAAGPLAATGMPLLLNDGASLQAALRQHLVWRPGSQLVIVGGQAAIPDSVETALGQVDAEVLARAAGGNRFETAAHLAYWLSSSPDCVLLVSGETFPDALAAGPLGGRDGCPILLARRDSLPTATRDWLVANAGTVEQVIAVGGSAVVSDAVVDAAVAAATA